MLLGDWESNLLPLLQERTNDIDVIVWDLCDERLGLRQLSPPAGSRISSLATRSVDSLSSGFDTALGNCPIIPFGSSRHKTRFQRALGEFRKSLETLGLADKLLILAPPWARYSHDGTDAPTSFGLSAGRANRIYDTYYAAITETLDAPLVTIPEKEVFCDPTHQWGPAPFHYTEKIYRRLASKIVSLTN